MEIKINNSKLKIVKVPFEKGDSSITLINKYNLKYQFVVFTNPIDKKLCPQKKVDSVGLKKIYLESSISDNYSECWSLELEKGVSTFSNNSYTEDELKIIMSFIYVTVLDHQDTSEILCLCTEDYNIISKFYSTYGRNGINEFKLFINNCIKNNKYSPIITKEYFPINYTRDKYSIQNLISDLIKDGAYILTNKYLIGEIKNISVEKKDVSKTSIVSSEDEWYKILGILGNKTRANLSITYSKKVTVYIPDNDSKVECGMREFDSTSSICIVKDGILWQRTLGVRISSKLAGKLKRLGIIKGELLYPGEYLIDFSTIPIVSKSKIKEITSSKLAELEVRDVLAEIAIDYLNYTYPDVVEVIDEKEKFYRELGIINGRYYPKTTETIRSGKSYTTVELVSNIIGLPTSHSERIKEFERIKKKKSCGGIYSFINSLGITSDNILELKKKWKLEKQKTSIELRDAKFQIITSKSSKFSEKGNPFIDNVVKSVNIGTISDKFGSYSYMVNISWNFKKKRINL